ncbi:MAG: hypothetical protein AAF721_27155 [Myxococcota bacterium]
MAQPDNVIQFVGCEPVAIGTAVRDALQRMPTPWHRAGGGSSTGSRCVNLLQVCYAVASVDGFARVERMALSHLLKVVTGSPVKQAAMEQHFSALDDRIERRGRAGVLAMLATSVDNLDGRDETIVIAAMVAMADGALSQAEMDELSELAYQMRIPVEQADALVAEAAHRIRDAVAVAPPGSVAQSS